MREILFRGKRLDNGEWAYGYLVKRPSAVQWGDDGGPWYIDVPPVDPDDNYKNHNVDPATVGQFTGAHDKNGKMIFEGDILRGKERCAYVVQWSDDIVMFVARALEDGVRTYPGLNIGTTKYYEVVANIHDNPELLGGEAHGGD